MKPLWRLALSSAVLSIVAVPSFAQPQYGRATQHKAEFWIGAVDPVVQNDRKIANPADYMELFGPPGRWPNLAARTTTLEISTQYILRGSAEQHRALIEGLKANHLKLAGQFGVEEASGNPSCGDWLEGRGGPANAGGVAKHVYDLGIQLDYIDMDEPITWGRESPRNRCPESVAKLAQTAAQKVALYHHLFPAMRVNLIDAVGGRSPSQVSDEIEFVDALARLGVHIDYFLADVQWNSGNWQPAFEELAPQLHARRIKVGMYCDGLLTSKTDLAWDRDSVNNCATAGQDPRISPDLYMIGSWSPWPTKVFPETQPGTLTHIGFRLSNMFR